MRGRPEKTLFSYVRILANLKSENVEIVSSDPISLPLLPDVSENSDIVPSLQDNEVAVVIHQENVEIVSSDPISLPSLSDVSENSDKVHPSLRGDEVAVAIQDVAPQQAQPDSGNQPHNVEDESITIDEKVRLITINRSIHINERCDFTAYKYNVIIKGDIENGATVISNNNLDVEGAIGNDCVITARLNIKATNVGKNSNLTAKDGWIRLKDVDKDAKILAWGDINTHDVASGVVITSDKGNLSLNHVGEGVELTAPAQICFRSVHPSVKLNAPDLFVKMDEAGRFYEEYVPPAKDAVDSLLNMQPQVGVAIVGSNIGQINIHTTFGSTGMSTCTSIVGSSSTPNNSNPSSNKRYA